MPDRRDPPPPTSPPSATLAYGPKTNAAGHRLATAMVVLAALAVAAAVGTATLRRPAGRAWERLRDRRQVAAWQAQALAPAPPADLAVVEFDPARREALLADPRYRRAATEYEALYAEFTDRPTTLYVESASGPRMRRADPAQTPAASTVYVGRRDAPAGDGRMVHVRFRAQPGSDGGEMLGTLYPSLFVPGTAWREPVDAKFHLGAGGRPLDLCWPKGADFRLFAGQPDPADPSRFTIAYEYEGRPGEVVGRLDADEAVTLTPSTGVVETRTTTRRVDGATFTFTLREWRPAGDLPSVAP